MTFWLRRWHEQSRTPTPTRAVAVGDDLHLDCRAGADELLEEAAFVAEGLCASAARSSNAAGSASGPSTRRMPRPPPPAAALTMSGKPMRAASRERLLDGLDRAAAPRRDRHAGLLGEPLGGDLVAERRMTPASGPTKTMPSRSHSSANSGCSATKPHPAHDGVGARGERALERAVVEVPLPSHAGRGRAVGLVGLADEHRVALGLGVEGDVRIGSARCA